MSKMPEYELMLSSNVLTLTIDFNGAAENSEHMREGFRRALANGDLYKLVEYNMCNALPLIEGERA